MRKKTLFSFVVSVLCLVVTTATFAQTGKISGKVLNAKNEPLPGVSVKVTGVQGGATTDVEGRYTLTLPAGKKYDLDFTSVGYTLKPVSDIEVVAGQVTNLDIVLEVAGKNLSGVTVTAVRSNARRETVNSLIQFQKNTNTVAAVVSAEAIRRSPDRNSGEVLKRLPGTSIQEGKYLIVRGLADRYNQAMLNGILMGSTEADRKTFSFDLIPSAMIDNMIINKAFVPELPGEWAGGLVQVNTRDIPAQNFFTLQIGTGFNTQAISNDFYTYKGGKLDFLGVDDGARELPSSYTNKTAFAQLSPAEKTAIGKQFKNTWSTEKMSAPLNASFQASGGFNTTIFKNKKLGAIFGLTYNKNNRYVKLTNNGYSFASSSVYTPDFAYNDDRYSQEILAGALGTVTLQLNNNNKISYKTIFNISTTDYTTLRKGVLNNGTGFDSARGTELAFKQNMFWNNQITGEHNLPKADLKLKWFGSFNILDAYVPDQRRLVYQKDNSNPANGYKLLISNVLSQQSANRFYQFLNDYIYTAGGDLTKTFTLFGTKQSVKGGYFFQVKDRLFDAKPFSIYLPTNNEQLKSLSPDVVFNPENFGNGTDNKFGFDAIQGSAYRYLANTILNAGFIQFDNQFSNWLRVVWGVRVEDYDQLIGSVKQKDPRHSHSEVTDFLPGINATFKLNPKTNIRLSGSQTVVRPEFRELAPFIYYDFDLNAAVQGNPGLERTKISNLDLRYELYPGAGEVFTLGVFYKHFDKPIEQIFNLGGGGSSTFNYQNPDKADAYGAELEFRKKLEFIPALKNFTFQTNLSYIKSKVNDARYSLDRPLQGQSDYLINAGLLYDLDKAGFNATLLFNQIGKRIAYVGSNVVGNYSPDIWEGSRPLLDLQLAQKVLKKKGEIRVNVSDILNRKLYFYQNSDGNTILNKNQDPYRFTRQFGTTVNISFGYTF